MPWKTAGAPPLRSSAESPRHVAQGAWLDVEFGNGALLFTAAEWGYEPVGLAESADSVAALRRLGIEAHCGRLADFAGNGRFSVLSLADLLPRQPFPKEVLKAAHRLLRPGGVLFLSMPNREPMLFNLLQAHAANPHWRAIDHYHLFGRSRLYRLLRDHGLRARRLSDQRSPQGRDGSDRAEARLSKAAAHDCAR